MFNVGKAASLTAHTVNGRIDNMVSDSSWILWLKRELILLLWHIKLFCNKFFGILALFLRKILITKNCSAKYFLSFYFKLDGSLHTISVRVFNPLLQQFWWALQENGKKNVTVEEEETAKKILKNKFSLFRSSVHLTCSVKQMIVTSPFCQKGVVFKGKIILMKRQSNYFNNFISMFS